MQDKDQLEEFIKEHKASFDTIEAPKGIWDKIESDLDKSIEPSKPVLWYWKVAVIVLLGAVIVLVADKYVPNGASQEQLSEVSEFEELETFYTSIINKKESKLKEELKGEEAINYLEIDIEELDLLYQDLRKVYLEEQTTPEVYDRLMHLLRQRLHLINSQLDIIAQEKMPEDLKVKMN